MNVHVTAVPPAPGSAEPANLYVDLQSRALWLGVDTAVDPDGAVLISDIVQLEADIAASVVTSKTYTDNQIATRAPLVHTHTASQITDFEAAVDAAVSNNPQSLGIPIAGIIMWAGGLQDIGVGNLANYHLCDGSTVDAPWAPGTPWVLPDLRDRFIIGAGNKTPWTKNPNTSFKTDTQGVHTHTASSTALTEAQMPAHAHWTTISGRAYGATYGGAGSHQHLIGASFIGSGIGSTGGYVKQAGGSDVGTTWAGAHEHSCYVDISIGVATDTRGSSTGHTHSLTSSGGHDHTITQAQVRDVMPYFALAYIVRIA